MTSAGVVVLAGAQSRDGDVGDPSVSALSGDRARSDC